MYSHCRSWAARAVSVAPLRAAFFGTTAATRDEASADTPPWKNTFAAKPSAQVREGLKKERKQDRDLEIDSRWNKRALPSCFLACPVCCAAHVPTVLLFLAVAAVPHTSVQPGCCAFESAVVATCCMGACRCTACSVATVSVVNKCVIAGIQ